MCQSYTKREARCGASKLYGTWHGHFPAGMPRRLSEDTEPREAIGAHFFRLFTSLHPFDQTPTSLRIVCRRARTTFTILEDGGYVVNISGLLWRPPFTKCLPQSRSWLFVSHLSREMAWIHFYFLSGSTGNANNSRSLCEAIGAVHGATANRHRTHYLETQEQDLCKRMFARDVIMQVVYIYMQIR